MCWATSVYLKPRRGICQGQNRRPRLRVCGLRVPTAKRQAGGLGACYNDLRPPPVLSPPKPIRRFAMSNGKSQNYVDPEDMFADTRMSFGDHLEDLRTHLWRAVKSFIICMIL